MVGEGFPEPTEDEITPEAAADHQASIEGEVWSGIKEGIGDAPWQYTQEQADEYYAAWKDSYLRFLHPNRHEK